MGFVRRMIIKIFAKKKRISPFRCWALSGALFRSPTVLVPNGFIYRAYAYDNAYKGPSSPTTVFDGAM